MARILVAGCGYVGTALGHRLAAAGHAVFGARRRAEGLPPPITPVAADLTDATSLREIPEALDRVVYAVSPDGGGEGAYRRAYVQGLEILLAFLERRGDPVRRVLVTTSTGVYGQTGGEWVDERSATDTGHPTARAMLDGERVAASGPFRGTVLRLSGIYGPGRTRLVERVRSGRARLPPDGPRWSNRIHRDDAAGALAHLLFLPEPERVYVGSDHEPADLADVMRWLARQVGAPTPPPAEDDPEPSAGRRRRSRKRCDNARLVGSGHVFTYPTYREGYRQVLAGP